jgi:butyrate kinase
VSLEGVDAFVGRGGGLVALEGGTYPVNEKLLEHARMGYTIKHPAMLGSQIAYAFAGTYGGRAFVVNPPDVDEMIDEARITGLADVFRESRTHALNQKEVALRHAAVLGKPYNEVNFVVAHLGGGVSVTAHRKGRMIDTVDIAAGDGPMAPTRSGALPASAVVKLCYSGKYTEKQMMDRILKSGGFVDHLGTSDAYEVDQKAKAGDKRAKLVYDSFAYQVIKSIGAYAAALEGDVDGILISGGIAKDKGLMEKITKAVRFIAPVTVYAGEFEMEALAAGAIRVLSGEEEPKTYTGVPIWQGLD